jgi:hypothetical protein
MDVDKIDPAVAFDPGFGVSSEWCVGVGWSEEQEVRLIRRPIFDDLDGATRQLGGLRAIVSSST